MKELPFESLWNLLVFKSVKLVSCDGVTKVGKVYPDLMLSPCFWLNRARAPAANRVASVADSFRSCVSAEVIKNRHKQ